MNRVDDPRASDEETSDHQPHPAPPVWPYFGEGGSPVEVVFGGCSHEGKVRPNNEDHFAVIRRRRRRDLLLGNVPEGLLPELDEDAYVLVVADGMGGAAFGELASLLALQAGWDLGLRDVKWNIKVDEHELREVMRKADTYYREIDRSLIEHARREPRLTGMGTTLTLAYTIGSEAIIAHAGDSRAYLYRDGLLLQLTHDHTMAQELADFGVIRPEDVATHRMRNVLTNCLGGPGLGVDPDVFHVRLSDGDGLLLCTDGLSDLVNEAEMTRVLQEQPDPQRACRSLVDLALDRGGNDNITVVLGRYRLVEAQSA